MTPRFVFHPAAQEDLADARDWYDSQREGLSAELETAVVASLDRIRAAPFGYPEIEPGLRRFVMDRFPYAIFYEVGAASIRVVAVFHHRRDPRQWRVRRTF